MFLFFLYLKNGITIITILFGFGIIIVLRIMFNEESVNYIPSNSQTEKVYSVIEEVTSKDISISEAEKIVGDDFSNLHLVIGNDSYLRKSLPDDIVKKRKLEKYMENENKYADRVEKLYLDNLSYHVIDTYTTNNKECFKIEIITFYYSLYLHDLIDLTNGIVKDNIASVSDDIKAEINYFKAHVKAMSVLDKHINNYVNKRSEKAYTNVCFVDGQIESKDAALTLVTALQGQTYSNCNFADQNNVEKTNARINKYLKDAKK